MRSPQEPDAVQPALRRAEAEVARRLEEACVEIERKDLSQESMDELLRLEDELLAAARAVEETVRLRRQLGDRPKSESQPRDDVATAPGPSSEERPGGRLRDFSDAEGREWRVWEVRPGSSGRKTDPERYLGEYVRGWLAFECPEADIRRRLPNHPPDWFRMADAELGQLLSHAVEVKKRKPRDSGP